MPIEMLDRLRLDPGCRTIGELLQERAWAVHEIDKLRSLHVQGSTPSRRSKIGGQPDHVIPSRSAEMIRTNVDQQSGQLLRLGDVAQLVGLSRSSIYQLIQRNRFPPGVKVGLRARRWRVGDILAWQSGLGR